MLTLYNLMDWSLEGFEMEDNVRYLISFLSLDTFSAVLCCTNERRLSCPLLKYATNGRWCFFPRVLLPACSVCCVGISMELESSPNEIRHCSSVVHRRLLLFFDAYCLRVALPCRPVLSVACVFKM
jgi:hypothetical protein